VGERTGLLVFGTNRPSQLVRGNAAELKPTAPVLAASLNLNPRPLSLPRRRVEAPQELGFFFLEHTNLIEDLGLEH
jgi:hypothetical protein